MFGGSDTSFTAAIRQIQGTSHCPLADRSPQSAQLLIS